jgi:sugar lactone lactonase YvrE
MTPTPRPLLARCMPLLAALTALWMLGATGGDQRLQGQHSYILGNDIFPAHIAFDTRQTLWITDTNGFDHKLFKISPDEDLTAIALPDNREVDEIADGGDGSLWGVSGQELVFGLSKPDLVVQIGPDGILHEFQTKYNQISAIVLGPDKRPWFADFFTGAVCEIDEQGAVRLVATIPDAEIYSMIVGPDGNVWFGDTKEGRVGKITPSGQVTLFATPAKDSYPEDLAASPTGFIWVAESGRNAIARVSLDGTFKEYVIPENDSWPGGLALDGAGDVWFVERRKQNRIARLKADGSYDDWPLPGENVFPKQVRIDSRGRIWVASSAADYQGHQDQTYSPSTIFRYDPPQ